MKKRFALLLAAYFVCSLLPMGALAAPAANPTRVPDIGEAVTVYTKADMVLDFSAYVFSTMDAAGVEQAGGVRGLTNTMKIWVATEDAQQFTAYCLDKNRSYPSGISEEGELSLYVQDTDTLLALFARVVGENDTVANGSDPNNSACFGDLVAAHGAITGFSINDIATPVDQAMLDRFNANERIEFQISSATFADGYTHTAPYGGYWIYGFWKYSLGVSPENFTTVAWPDGENFDKMLWVMEHTYPAIPMEVMMADAGADYDRLRSEIGSAQPALSSDELDALAESVVYATIQQAIWHHQPAKVNDDPERYIGPTMLSGHEDTKLLYEYLTCDRDEYTGYRNKVLGSSLRIAHGELEPIKRGDGYQYGPMHIETDLLSAGDIRLNANAPGLDVRIIDAAGDEISSVRQEEPFYLIVGSAPAAETKLTIQAATTNALTLNSSDRGRMYVAVDPDTAAQVQPVGTGGTPQTAQSKDSLRITLPATEAEPTPTPTPDTPTPMPTPDTPEPTPTPTPDTPTPTPTPDAPTPTPTIEPTYVPTPTPSAKPQEQTPVPTIPPAPTQIPWPSATPTPTPKVTVIPQTGVESNTWLCVVGAMLLGAAAGTLLVRILRKRGEHAAVRRNKRSR